VPVGCAAIVRADPGYVDSISTRSYSMPAGIHVLGNILDSAIPGAVAVADAVNQYGYAVIRFPEGKGWDDLFDRKTPGWEGWKHPVAKASSGGVDGGNVAVAQAGLSPVAIANLALQGAAMVVGQAYMAKIDNKLKNIEKGIDEILCRMDDQRLAKLRGYSRTLDDYHDGFSLYEGEDSTRFRAISVVGATLSSLAASTEEELLAIDRVSKSLRSEGRIGKERAEERLAEIDAVSNRALFSICLEAAARRLLMQYEGQYTRTRVNHELSRVRRVCSEYRGHCSEVASELRKVAGIETLSPIGRFFEGLRYDETGKKDDGIAPLIKMGGTAFFGGLIGAVGMFAGSEMAHIAAEDRRQIDRSTTEIGSAVDTLLSEFENDIGNLNFIHEGANALALGNGAIHFLSMGK